VVVGSWSRGGPYLYAVGPGRQGVPEGGDRVGRRVCGVAAMCAHHRRPRLRTGKHGRRIARVSGQWSAATPGPVTSAMNSPGPAHPRDCPANAARLPPSRALGGTKPTSTLGAIRAPQHRLPRSQCARRAMGTHPSAEACAGRRQQRLALRRALLVLWQLRAPPPGPQHHREPGHRHRGHEQAPEASARGTSLGVAERPARGGRTPCPQWSHTASQVAGCCSWPEP
jgi:hypothetical protein